MPRLTQLLLILLLLSHFPLQAQASASVLSYDSFEEARAISMQAGKPLIVFFTADWIMPCQWMEEHTFTNPPVKELLNASYTSARIDIDKAEGKSLKQRFGVTKLPTLLFFDTKGTLKKTIEESVNAEDLLKELSGFLEVLPALMSAEIEPEEPGLEIPKPILQISRPAIIPENHIDTETSEVQTAPEQYSVYIPQHNATLYSIQIGAYNDYDNALKARQKVNKVSDLQVSILKEIDDNRKDLYRVLVGNFDNIELANKQIQELKRYKVDGFVFVMP